MLCVAYLVVWPSSLDYASGDFRAKLFDGGSYLWNNLWFGGHSLPGYGLLPPMLGATLGVLPVAIASAILSSYCFVLVVDHYHRSKVTTPNPLLALALLSVSSTVSLWGGRLTFGPSVLAAVACIAAAQREKKWLAVLFAVLCGLSSPVAALSLALVAGGCWFTRALERRTALYIGLGCVIPMGVLIVAFPEGGWYPFTGRSFLFVSAVTLLAGWFARHVRVVLYTAVMYEVVALGAFVIQSPLGGNIVRLAWLVAGPVAALTMKKYRSTLLPLFVATWLVWSWAYVEMAFKPRPASAEASFYTPLTSYIKTLPGEPRRVEVVPTASFRQADDVALAVGLARGWETQLDRKLNPEFYGDVLTEQSFHTWLVKNSVRLVALPEGALSPFAEIEAAIIRARPAYLHPVWSNQNWQLFEVSDAPTLASNGATVTDVEPESLTVMATKSGPTTVRFRFTKWYNVVEGRACVTESPDGWVSLDVRAPGEIRIEARFSLPAVLGQDSDCPVS